MYHDVALGTPGSGSGPERFSVSIASFERMLDTIAGDGYVGCSLATAIDLRDRPRVGITFDDGRVGQFDHAVPALRRRNMTATFFVTTDWVGTPGFMTWDQLRQLTDWGMSVQSHTKSHPHLSELDYERLRSELAESKVVLDHALGQETTQTVGVRLTLRTKRVLELMAEQRDQTMAVLLRGFIAEALEWKDPAIADELRHTGLGARRRNAAE